MTKKQHHKSILGMTQINLHGHLLQKKKKNLIKDFDNKKSKIISSSFFVINTNRLRARTWTRRPDYLPFTQKVKSI